MDPIEKAIRTAFEKGDRSDPAFRQKVYRSAFAALDRALQAKPDTTVERAIARRKDLQRRIGEIEEEFAAPRPRPAAPGEDPLAALAAERDDRFAAEPRPRAGAGKGAERFEPTLDGIAADAGASHAAADEGLTASDPERVRRIGSRRGLGLLATVLVLLAAVGIGGWWAINGGLPLPGGGAGGREGTAPRAVADEIAGAEPERGGPLGSTAETRDWISVFTPADPSTVSVPEGGEARDATGEGVPLLRVRGGRGGEPVRFRVARETLARFAGRRALFDIVARTEDGAETQVAVECDFGGFGTCRRSRYTVTDAARGELLFEVEFPKGEPPAGGAILVRPDVTGTGKALDVYEIRAAVSE